MSRWLLFAVMRSLFCSSVFNYRRNEVRSFLLGAAYHWLRRYHIDGLRIDAVSSMLYKNHQKKDGEWLPNEHGGDANLQAISLLQELNWVVHKEFPGVFTMAEESTSWRGVTDKADGQATTQVHPTAPSVESSRRAKAALLRQGFLQMLWQRSFQEELWG